MQYGLYYVIIYTIIISLMTAQLSEHKKTINKKLDKTSDYNPTIIISMIFMLVVRVMFSGVIRGLNSDMNCFDGWSDKLFVEPIQNFYWTGDFADYPPGYMLVLWFVGAFKRSFGLVPPATWMAVKFPAMLCDVLLAWFIYKMAKEKYNHKFAINIFYIFALNPLVILDSVFWGQIDSVMTLFLVMSLYQMDKKKYFQSAMLFVVSALMKPQALLVFPIYVFVFVRTKDWKMMLKSIGFGLLLMWAVSVPFSPAWQDVSGAGSAFLAFFKTFNIFWVIEKYLSTMGQYAYASLNAYNFYTLILANWRPLSERFLFATYGFWGNVFIVMTVLASFWGMYKLKDKDGEGFGTAFFVLMVLFTIGTSMHERYLYPAVVFLLVLYIIKGDRRLLFSFIMLSFISFANIGHILSLEMINGNTDATLGVNPAVMFISACQVIMFVYIMWLMYKIFFKGEIVQDTADKKPVNVSSRVSAGGKKRAGRLEGWFLPNNDTLEEIKLVRWDYIIMAGFILVYSLLAFWNLGDNFAPESFYKPITPGEQFTVEFEETQMLNKISFYLGIGDAGYKPGIDFEYSEDGENWSKLKTNVDPDPITKDKMAALKNVFMWNENKFDAILAKYVRGKPEAVNLYDVTPIIVQYTVGELAFWNNEGKQIAIASVNGTEGAGNYEAMFDEQWLVPEKSTFMNGSYFDEIYHPRTAYEHVNLLPYYETTHPPLGKLFIALGVKVFGMNPFGWRVMGTLFGIFMIPVFYIFIKKMFHTTRFAFIGTLMFTFDFMHYSLTRIGTIDSYPVFFIMTSYYFMYTFGQRAVHYAKNDGDNFFTRNNIWKMLIPLMLSGIIWGLSCASKWIGIYAGLGLFILFVIIMFMVYKRLAAAGHMRTFEKFILSCIGWCLIFFVAVPVAIYIASYIPISMVPGYEDLMKTVLDNQKYMYEYHSKISDWHPFSSAWWQWPIMVRPLWAYQAPAGSVAQGNVSSISIMGNPMIWWLGIGASFYAVYYGIRRKSKTVAFASIGLLSQYMPWWTISRVIFIYHFFASVPFMIMLMLYTIRELELKYAKFKYVTAVYCVLVVAMFVMFFPILSGLEIPKQYGLDFLKWFETWTIF